MARLQFEFEGLKQLDRNLQISLDGVEDLQPLLKAAIDVVDEREDDIFEADGQNLEKSSKWGPHAASTSRARANRWGYYRQSPNKPGINRWTGKLQESKTTKASQSQAELSFGTNYAGYVNNKRKLIDLDTKTNQNIIKAVQKTLVDLGGLFR